MAKDLKIEIPSVDDLFKLSTNKGKAENVVMIPLNEISNFPNHPFKVERNEELEEMVESIKSGGVRQPVIVRAKEDGGYEMVSGHRRKLASEIAGLKEIPAIIRELTRDEATILMVDSNIQREKILPSEKAFAYKMKKEALKHQGKRNDLTSSQVGTKLRTDEKIANEFGESRNQIQRYIRLTELIKELLDLVDTGKIAFNPAVEISYLQQDEQYVLLDCINKYESTPSQAQAIHLKKLSQEGSLTADKISEIIEEEKPNQKPKYQINYDRFKDYVPKNVATPKEMEDYLLECAKEHYKRIQQRKRDWER